jgi:ligand-binding sensor domain-containing protein
LEGTSNGHLPIIASEGFVEWDGAQIVNHPDLATRLGVPANQIYHVMEDSKGARWYCSAPGVAREAGGVIQQFQPYGVARKKPAYLAYEDPQGSVWINLIGHLHPYIHGKVETVPDVEARYMCADRDGSLWLGTNGSGLLRLKDRTARIFTTADGLGGNTTMAVLTAHDGKLWVGNNCGGLAWLDGDHFRSYSHADGLTNSCVYSLAADLNHDLWIGTWGRGSFSLSRRLFYAVLKA